jgi:glycosyltransferase involved in cell wall biosynthesis
MHHFVHVPIPGDHYSPATGSAVITVIAELSRIHQRYGGRTTLLVGRRTQEGYPPYEVGQLREIPFPPRLPSRAKKAMDAACGLLFFSRPNAASLYTEIPNALEGSSFDGTLFIHNAPHAIGYLRRKLPNCKLALHAHNQLFNTYSRREIRYILDSCDVLLCCSAFIAEDIDRRAGTRSPKLKSVLNGVNTDTFAPGAAQDCDPPVILFIGRILPEKGPDLLLKAAVELARKSRHFKLRIIGSSNFNPKDPLTAYEKGLRKLAEPIGDLVEFRPFVARPLIPDEYRRATIAVIPSNWDEPFGLTLAEALACGLPSVASRRGGLPEVAGDAALYFTPPDYLQLAKHLQNLLQNRELRLEYAQRARTRAMALCWSNRYRDLLAALEIQHLLESSIQNA